jgi:hypothetical protein
MSAGRPQQTKYDALKFREQYMASLKLQSDINEANLRANQLYVKTGMPAATPTDYRTITEKVGDVVKIRSELVASLKEITDGTNSQAIVAGLNADQVIYVAQHMPDIISILKPKYKYGVPSAVFLTTFLPRYQADEYRNALQAQNLPPQNAVDAAIIDANLPVGDPLNLPAAPEPRRFPLSLDTPEDTKRRRVSASRTQSQSPKQKASSEERARELYKELGDVSEQLDSLNPADEENEVAIFNVKSKIQQIGNELLETEGLDADIRDNTMYIFDFLKIPIPQQQPTLVKMGAVDQPIYSSPHALSFPSFASLPPSDPPSMSQSITSENLGEEESTLALYSKKSEKKTAESEPDDLDISFPMKIRLSTYTTTEGEKLIQEFAQNYKSTADFIDEIAKKTLKKEAIKIEVERLERLILPHFSKYKELEAEYGPIPYAAKMQLNYFGPLTNTTEALKIRYAALNNFLGEIASQLTGLKQPSSGFGLGRMKGRGISEANKWTEFGKYKLNAHKLDSGVLSLRTSSGFVVGKYPNQKLSSGTIPIISEIIDGHQPSFTNLSKLTPDETSFVKRLLKDACVFQHVGSGLPSNPSDDEDVREFEIMKGELLAGNDNKTLVQNFKKQIFKLINRDLLPKNEGKELLMELAMLGH